MVSEYPVDDQTHRHVEKLERKIVELELEVDRQKRIANHVKDNAKEYCRRWVQACQQGPYADDFAQLFVHRLNLLFALQPRALQQLMEFEVPWPELPEAEAAIFEAHGFQHNGNDTMCVKTLLNNLLGWDYGQRAVIAELRTSMAIDSKRPLHGWDTVGPEVMRRCSSGDGNGCGRELAPHQVVIDGSIAVCGDCVCDGCGAVMEPCDRGKRICGPCMDQLEEKMDLALQIETLTVGERCRLVNEQGQHTPWMTRLALYRACHDSHCLFEGA